MARTVKMFDIGEKVFIEVEVADISCKKGELKYTLKDPLTSKTFDYLYTEEQMISAEQLKQIPTKTTAKKTETTVKKK